MKAAAGRYECVRFPMVYKNDIRMTFFSEKEREREMGKVEKDETEGEFAFFLILPRGVIWGIRERCLPI